jgi:hypothetical protein
MHSWLIALKQGSELHSARTREGIHLQLGSLFVRGGPSISLLLKASY